MIEQKDNVDVVKFVKGFVKMAAENILELNKAIMIQAKALINLDQRVHKLEKKKNKKK
jgi:hypothetical protein